MAKRARTTKTRCKAPAAKRARPKVKSKAPERPVDEFIRDVLAGKILVGELARLAVQRHADDLSAGCDRGLRFDPAAGERALKFFALLRHCKGEWAGKAFDLAPWQMFIIWALFGWLRADGSRRFREVYIEVARKNGKSTLAAGIALYLLIADREEGAEVYSAATTRDQAKIVHDTAREMARRSPQLAAVVKPYRTALVYERGGSKFVALAAEDDKLDGLNASGVILDEVHAHPTRGLYDVLKESMAARRQPLLVSVTTAGFGGRESLCYELHDDGVNVLKGAAASDELFVWIATLDEGDDWRDESTWVKANPLLGITPKLDDMRSLAEKAKRIPSAQNSFRRKRLNQWTEQAERWLPMDLWITSGATPVVINGLVGLPCTGGLDCSTTTDLSALVFSFRRESQRVLLPFFFMPADRLQERSEQDHVDFVGWARDGWIQATEGNVIDYGWIRNCVLAQADKFELRELAYDPWNATQLAVQLQRDGITMVPCRQGFATLNGPSKELERLLAAGDLLHGNHPVLNWMAANVVAEHDPADNIKPSKAKSTTRIDGIVAAVMAIWRDQLLGDDVGSVYERRGVLSL